MSISKKIIASLCAASTVLSVAFATTSAAQTSIVPISGCGVSVEVTDDGTLVYGIPPSTSVENAAMLFEGDVSFTSNYQYVTTGSILTLTENGSVKETASVIISGDANCDGVINGKDTVRIAKYLRNPDDTQINLYAADVDRSGEVDSEDMLAISEKITSSSVEISLLKAPDKTSYFVSQKFSCNGMILMETYSNGDKYAVCDGFTVAYQNGECISENDTFVTVSYGNFKADIPISVNSSNVYVLSEYVDDVIEITTAGEHIFTGYSENTQITVNAPGCEVYLVFSDAIYTYTGADAPLNLLSADSVTIQTLDGESCISDTSTNTTESAIYSVVPLKLEGEGTLKINGNSSEGITVSKADFVIDSGTYIINAVKNGIQPKGKGVSFTVNGGSFDITAGGDGIKNSKTGITLNGGDYKISAGGDGIQAETELTISAGTYNITTSGGYLSDSGNSTSSAWVYEAVAEADMPTSQEEYYGLYVLSGTTYIEIDETNYSKYSSYTTLYDRSSSKGIKSGTDMVISNAIITLNCLDDGIKADGTFTLNSGNVNIKTACDGIQSDSVLTVNGGTLDILGVGAFYQNSTSGKFKYQNGEYVRTSSDSGGMRPGSSSSSTLYALFNSGKGLKAETELYINGGTIDIEGIDDNIHCDGSLYVRNGNITLSTMDDGLHAELSAVIGSLTDTACSPYVNITKSYEGVEGIYIDFYSGTTVVNSSDDGINAAGDLEASSSYYLSFDGSCEVYVYAEGDGLDANGYMYIYDGNIYVFGPTSGGNGIIDYDSNFEIHGGTFLAVGNKDMAQTATKASQYVLGYTVSSGSFTSGTYLNISGADITCKLPKSYSSSLLVLVSSPAFSKGNTYRVSYGGTYTGGVIEHSICSGGTYSSGTTGASLTTSSSYITSMSGFNSGGGNRPF